MKVGLNNLPGTVEPSGVFSVTLLQLTCSETSIPWFTSLMLYDPANHVSCALTNMLERISGSEESPMLWALSQLWLHHFFVTSPQVFEREIRLVAE